MMNKGMMNKVILTYLFSFLLCSLLDGVPLQISSNEAIGSKKSLVLDGDVTLEHSLGMLFANHAEVESLESQDKVAFEMIHLKDKVKISLADGGTLLANSANLNILTLEGVFKGDVEYLDGAKENSLHLQSMGMSINLSKPEQKNQNGKQFIEKIIAEEQVKIEYDHNFVALGDIARYVRVGKDSNSKLNGIITLEGENKCSVVNKDHDQIRASFISIDTERGILAFLRPEGALHLSDEKSKVVFSSDTMSWNDKSNILVLTGNCTVEQEGIGTLNSDKELVLKQHKVDGVNQIKTIESQGTTILTTKDDKSNHVLITYGSIIVDHEHLQTIVESPRDNQHNVFEGKQILFKDQFGQIFADKILITYELEEHKPVPKKIVLDGNVRMLNESKTDPTKKEPFFQYALADHVEYYPANKEVILSSNGKQRVLFFDKINNLQISAPAIKIKRDQVLNKDAIQGVGDVRFSFLEVEKSLLNYHFKDIKE